MIGPSVEDPKRVSPGASGLNWKAVAGGVIFALLLPATPFLAAGRLDWPMGLAYAAILFLALVSSRVIVALKHPDLLAERGRFAEARDAKAWDRKLMPVVGLLGPLVILVVAGLDERFGWSPEISLGVQIGGLVTVTLGYLLAVWAMVVNRFFSAVVRIQRDRGHSVISTGPYAVVRHPGYAGSLIASVVTGPVLGSLWAIVPTAFVLVLLVVRTALEDRTLREELEGYEEYAARVRYRLLPGLW